MTLTCGKEIRERKAFPAVPLADCALYDVKRRRLRASAYLFTVIFRPSCVLTP